MSYGKQHNQYSPYYQPLDIEQDGSGAGQTYHPNSYQPLSAYQSRPQQSPTQDSRASSSTYGNQGYGNVASAVNHGVYDVRNGYEHERSSVDATNLGNLAYASSLSRAGTSSQPSYSPNSSSNYALNTAISASKNHNRADNRGTTTSLGTDVSKRYLGTQAQYLPQGYSSNSGRSSPAQPQYATTQASQQPSRQYTPTQKPSEPSHATSGQGVSSANSGGAYQMNLSPRFAPSQNQSLQPNPQHSAGGQSQPQRRQHNSNDPVSSILNSSYQPAGTQQTATRHQESRQADVTSGPQYSNASNPHNSALEADVQTATNHPPSHVHAQVNRQRSQQPTPVQESHPATVDPSQVFNDYEYRRRKDEEMAKRKAAEAARSTETATPASHQLSGASQSGGARLHSDSSQPNDVLEAARSAVHNQREDDFATQDQMELEMKQMIEKMRDYKAKDPSLFSRIWEQVKKGQTPQAGSTKPATQRTSASPTVTNGQPSSPMQSEHPAEPEPSTASSFPPDFDRGRFPFQRRRRGALISSNYRGTKSHHRTPQSSQPPNAIPQSAAAPPASAAPVARMQSSDTVQTDQRLYDAMRNFHQSLMTPTPVPNSLGQRPPLPSHTNTEPIEPRPETSIHTSAQIAKPKPPVGKTKWPEDKKRALAEAAVIVLTNNPSNVGTKINADEIHALLDQNPSYTEMCEHLEARGFVVERGHFARFLLGAVPDIGVASPATKAPLLTTNQQAHEYVAPTSSQLPPPHDQNRHGQNYQKMLGQQSMSNEQHAHNSGKALTAPILVAKSTTKEDKARKRNFSDIVDLTQEMSDDEDFRRHCPRPRIESSSHHQSLDPAKMTISKTGSSAPAPSHTKKLEDTQHPSTDRDRILKERVAEPMNKRRDARRRSSYDPKTIARDVLIASGKHPTMAPLNYHLEILRDRFECINNDTDLCTFKWDIVDPVEKPSEREILPATLAEIMNQDDGDDATDGNSFPKLSANSAEKEARIERRGRQRKLSNPDTAGGMPRTAPGPTYRPTPNEKAAFRNEGIKNGPPLGTFKMPTKPQDPIGKAKRQQQDVNSMRLGHFSPQAHNAMTGVINQQNRSAMIQSFTFSPVATSNVPLNVASSNSLSSPLPPPATSAGERCVRCRRHHSHCDGQRPCSRCQKAGFDAEQCVVEKGKRGNLPAVDKPSASVKQSLSTRSAALSSPLPPALPTPPQRKEVVHGRKGRPPGAKNKQPRPDKGVPRGHKSSSPLASNLVPPPSANNSIPRRNSGLRNAISPTNGVAVVIQQRSPSVVGSESQHGTENLNNIKVTAPVYRPYKCRWDECPAELHNLETFRKHVHKHRRDLEKPIPCKMPGCDHPTDGGDEGVWLMLQDEAAWDTHVEKEHIRPVAKKQGEVLSGDSDEVSSD